jgi:hypothetical protein
MESSSYAHWNFKNQGDLVIFAVVTAVTLTIPSVTWVAVSILVQRLLRMEMDEGQRRSRAAVAVAVLGMMPPIVVAVIAILD